MGFFLFYHFKDVMPWCFGFHCLLLQVIFILIIVHLNVLCLSSAYFLLFLFIFGFQQGHYDVSLCGFYVFILLMVHWAYWICEVMLLKNFWPLFLKYVSHLSLSLSLLLFWNSNFIYDTLFDLMPQVWCSLLLFFKFFFLSALQFE